MTTTLKHEGFYLPRPGADAPRVETYGANRYDDQGHPIGTVQVVRCQECAAATYDGVPR